MKRSGCCQSPLRKNEEDNSIDYDDNHVDDSIGKIDLLPSWSRTTRSNIVTVVGKKRLRLG